MAVFRAPVDRRWTVSGAVLGRTVAGAALPGARRRARGVHAARAGYDVAPGLVSLAEPRPGPEPARPGLRHPPSSGDRTDGHAGDQGPGCAGAVAGAARTHAGLDQAHSRRPAFAEARDPRPLGAARAGRGDAGGDLFRRRRRAGDASSGGVRLERRAVTGQYQGRCLGHAAALYRQAADHPVGCEQGRRRAAPDGPVAGSGRQHADRAFERRHA